MPSFRNSGSSMFGSIKSRLGIGGNDADYDDYGDYDDDYDTYSDNFDDYSTYDDERDRDMDRYGAVVERDASARRSRRSYTDAASSDFDERRRGNTGSHTPLVSIDDIRANTPRLNMDSPTGARSSTLTRHEFRSSDYMASGSIEREFIPDSGNTSSSSDDSPKRSGYDSLFSSTSGSAAADSGFRSEGSAAGRSTRNVVVLAPKDYAEVEKVARSLKAGDAVVLNLKTVSGDLSKRVLDFSFGVASALDADVDCVGEKVFAFTRYAQLSDAERMRLRGQGVL